MIAFYVWARTLRIRFYPIYIFVCVLKTSIERFIQCVNVGVERRWSTTSEDGIVNVFCIFNFLFDAEKLMYRLQLRQTVNVFRNVQGSLVCKLASAVWILRFQIRGAEVIH